MARKIFNDMTSFQFLQEYLGLIGSVLLLYLIILPFEIIIPIKKEQGWLRRFQNIIYMAGFLLVTLLLIIPVFNFIFPFIINATGGGLLDFSGMMPTGFFGHLIFGILFAFIWDFWQYSIHRLQHSSGFLWETHRFHHSEEYLNSTAQARTHITQYVFYLVLYFPMLLIFGGQTPHFIIAFLMFRVLGIYNHSNIRLNLGPLTPIISGPHWHRIHHSVDPQHRDKNFAAIFPVIDMIGGTYYRPQADEYPETGLTDPERVGYFRDATFLPLLKWREMVRKKS